MCTRCLYERCMLRYIVRAFVYPGRRVTFDGKSPDDDWTLGSKQGSALTSV